MIISSCFKNGKRILSTTNKAFEGKSFHQQYLGFITISVHPEIQIILYPFASPTFNSMLAFFPVSRVAVFFFFF